MMNRENTGWRKVLNEMGREENRALMGKVEFQRPQGSRKGAVSFGMWRS